MPRHAAPQYAQTCVYLHGGRAHPVLLEWKQGGVVSVTPTLTHILNWFHVPRLAVRAALALALADLLSPHLSFAAAHLATLRVRVDGRRLRATAATDVARTNNYELRSEQLVALSGFAG